MPPTLTMDRWFLTLVPANMVFLLVTWFPLHHSRFVPILLKATASFDLIANLHRMFNKIYHSAKPFERVKYGVLNLANDPAVSRVPSLSPASCELPPSCLWEPLIASNFDAQPVRC